MILMLQELLPNLEGETRENDELFKLETLKLLFNDQNFKFGNPVNHFKMNLLNGKYSENSERKRKILEKYRKKKEKLTLVTQHFANLQKSGKSQNVQITHEVKRLSRQASKKLKTMNLDERVGKRQITELRRIRLEVAEKGDSSDDENFIQELVSERDRKMSKLKSLQDWHQSSQLSTKTAAEKVPKIPAENHLEQNDLYS